MRIPFFLAFFGVLLADQITKHVIRTSLYLGECRIVVPHFFNLVSIRNRGSAFGFLNRSDIDWQIWLFLGATILAALFIYFMFLRTSSALILVLASGCILGGAVGNMIDRFRFGAVIDFLDLYWGKWHWPAFNVADMAICLGGGLLLFFTWKDPRQKGTAPSRTG